ncbi:EF-hand domain-containing protein [Rhizobium binae]|uniref:Ca2+-binding EF-hand superfamily protein n=1 Tax=Rhizobium binae TaxID=1138190 RepID=A0ABV2ML97_9HYPH|nr:EF-hand domain-containing protein [Rhizobium binae]NKL48775.1 EF-hand domain-containing protein [Rhizobium leguminosarum bv. viciae]MBX4936305.1 EF-hand domain-containing protein [Rhizobium binae]MBX4942622.1 EF-hand domain-containing protein [Rhizobium binae]MBX4950430.1 EF-hand domain-containing protein [Rhizobium binae]MBX4960490.1 EF-hand domain-containing protein [Rhizobium binae]
MKIVILVTAIIVSQSVGAFAQQSGSQQSTSMYQGQMDKLDVNASKTVDRSEYEAFMGTAFGNLDKNKDGSLQTGETVQILTAEQFTLTDANKDGRINRSEFMQRVMADFATADRDRDGNLQ